MELNITLTTIFAALLITGTVESTGWESGRPFKLPDVSSKSPVPEPSSVPKPLPVSTPPPSPKPPIKTLPAPSKVEDIASSSEVKKFRYAVQDGEMETASHSYTYGDDQLRKLKGEYLVSLGSSKLIELICETEDRGWILGALLVYADDFLIYQVFDKTRPSDDILRSVAQIADVACMPERYVYLLKKFKAPALFASLFQEIAVAQSVNALFMENKTNCFYPLLSALKKETFVSKNLEDKAISAAFTEASRYHDDRADFAKDFFDHPAVTAEDYSDALCRSYSNGDQTRELFRWLLARANLQDLEEVKLRQEFSEWASEFQKIVNDRLQIVGTKTRRELGDEIESAILMNEALEGILLKDLRHIITGYIKG